jgi:hypothetical protein
MKLFNFNYGDESIELHCAFSYLGDLTNTIANLNTDQVFWAITSINESVENVDFAKRCMEYFSEWIDKFYKEQLDNLVTPSDKR